MYNVAFTSVPIMWYALFDFEYEKDVNPLKGTAQTRGRLYYMRHPHLYRIGPEGACFGISHFARWVFYALAHAFLVYLINFYAVLSPG